MGRATTRKPFGSSVTNTVGSEGSGVFAALSENQLSPRSDTTPASVLCGPIADSVIAMATLSRRTRLDWPAEKSSGLPEQPKSQPSLSHTGKCFAKYVGQTWTGWSKSRAQIHRTRDMQAAASQRLHQSLTATTARSSHRAFAGVLAAKKKTDTPPFCMLMTGEGEFQNNSQFSHTPRLAATSQGGRDADCQWPCRAQPVSTLAMPPPVWHSHLQLRSRFIPVLCRKSPGAPVVTQLFGAHPSLPAPAAPVIEGAHHAEGGVVIRVAVIHR